MGRQLSKALTRLRVHTLSILKSMAIAAGGALSVDTINESTSGGGVTIDGAVT